MAVAAHVQGAVVLSAVISRSGTIENLRLMSGHPLLVQSAMDAVRQRRYRPYLLNGERVEVETQITVNFTLGGGSSFGPVPLWQSQQARRRFLAPWIA